MAIAPRGTATTYTSGGVATTTVTNSVPAGTALDDLIVWHFFGNITTDPTLTSGWTVAKSDSTTALRSTTWYRFATASEPGSYSATVASARWAGVMASYSGVDKTTPLDVTPPAVVTGTTTQVQPAITPVTAGAVILSLPAIIQTAANTSTLSSSNLDAIEAQATNTATAGTANPAGMIGREAWVSGAFTPIVTVNQATTRSLGHTIALRPGAVTATVALSGDGTLSASGAKGGVTDFVGTATFSGTGSLSAVPVGYQAFTYEEGTPGNVMTTSSPGVNGVVGGVPSAAPYYVASPFAGHGSVAARCDTITVVNNSWFRYNNYFGDLHTGQIYVQFDTIVSSNNPVVGFREVGIGASNTALVGQIRQGTGASVGKIILFSGASVTAATSTVAFASGDKCRLDWQFYKHGDLYDMSVRIYKNTNVEGTTPDDTISAVNMSTVAPGTVFGTITLGVFSANPGIYTYDTFRSWQGVNFWPPPYSTATTAFTGTATLGGDGTLAAGAAPAVPVAAALSGSGSLTTTQAPRPAVVAALSGDGSLLTTQKPASGGAAALSGSGSLTTTQAPRPAVTAVLSGAGTLLAFGVTAGQVAFNGAGILSTTSTIAIVIGGSYPAAVLATGPTGWWRHGESSGLVMVDSSGNSNDGVYVGPPALGQPGLLTGDPDTAIGFNGTNSMYGTMTYGTWLNRTTDLAFGQWIKSGVNTLQYTMQRWGATATDQIFGIDVNNTAHEVRGYVGLTGSGNRVLSTSGLNIDDGQRHLVMVVWRTSDSTLRIYVDGVAVAVDPAASGTLRITNTQIFIGRRTATATNFFNGTIDESYFGAALTPAQILAIYTAGITTPIGTALSGAGSLTTTQAPRPAQDATLSGAGTLAAAGVATAATAGTATLSGSGTLATTLLVPRLLPTVSLTGDGVLSTTQLVRVTGSAVLSGQGDLTAAGTAVNVTLDHLVTGMGWTDGTTYATPVVTGTTAATSVRLKVADDSGLTTNVRFTSPVTPDADGYAKHSITTIAPGGTAYYKVETTPGGALESQLGRAKAAPTKGVATGLSLNFSSCQTSAFPGNTAIWSAISTHLSPDVWMHLGDNGYDNNPSTVQADHRANLMSQANGRPAMAAAGYQTPSLWQRSDHDSGPSDNDPGGWNTADLEARKQIYPYPPLPNPSDGIYFDTWYGKIHVVVTDTRSNARTLKGQPDTSAKTRLGATQKAWLLARFAEPCDFLIWVCEAGWTGDGWSAGTATSGVTTWNLSVDGWVRFTTEQDQIAASIASNGLTKKMLYIAGDSHLLGADSGKNNTHGGFASAIAAPLDRATGGGNDGGPYTSGPYWRSTQGTVTQQFGNVTVTSNGTAFYTGWDVQDLTTPKVTLRVAQDIAALSGTGTLTAVTLPKFAGPGGLSGSGTLTTTQTPGPKFGATLSGSGSLSATGIASAGASGVATLAGAGTLSTTGTPRSTVGATLSGDGALSVVPKPAWAASVALSGAGTLTTTQVPRWAVSAALSGSGTLTTAPVTGVARVVALSGTGTLSATGTASAGAAVVVNFAGTGTLSTTVRVPRLTTTAALGGSGTLVATAKVKAVGLATLTGSGALTTSVIVKTKATATLSGLGILTVTLKPRLLRAAVLSGSGQLVIRQQRPGVPNVARNGALQAKDADGSWYPVVAIS